MKKSKICFKDFGRPLIKVEADDPEKAKNLFDKIFKEKFK